MKIGGKCSTASGHPVCWCYAPRDSNDQRKVTLSNCHRGVQMVLLFINAAASDVWAKRNGQALDEEGEEEIEAVAMHQFPQSRPPTRPRSGMSRRPNTSLFNRPSSFGDPSAGPSPSQQRQEVEDWYTRPGAPTKRRSDIPRRANTSLFTSPPSFRDPSARPSTSQQQKEVEDWNTRPDNEKEGRQRIFYYRRI